MSIEAQIASLADGTLSQERRERLLARLEDSPELTSALAQQRIAISLLGSLDDVRAPATLHSVVEALSAATPARRRPFLSAGWRLRPWLAAPAALAAAAVALILALAGHTAHRPSVVQAANLALQPATQPSPHERAGGSHVLDISMEGVPYPYWQGSLGWQATGYRTDRLGPRMVTTVFYRRQHGSSYQHVAYAIVSGSALRAPNGRAVSEAGIAFHVLDSGGATVVTWRRAGHTCVLVAHGVQAGTLMRLASWE